MCHSQSLPGGPDLTDIKEKYKIYNFLAQQMHK
jgi:hypothetical protein